MECVSCWQPFKTDATHCGAHTGKLDDPGGYLQCSERFDRYGDRSARISANRRALRTCSPIPTRRAGSEPILPAFVWGSLIGQRANGLRSRSSNPWLPQNKLRWNALLVCANRDIAIARSCWWIQTKGWSTWIELAGFSLRCLWRRQTILSDSEREQYEFKQGFRGNHCCQFMSGRIDSMSVWTRPLPWASA